MGRSVGLSMNVLPCLLRAGYGATTLPALSEAVLYERNVTLAEYEVARLIDLIRKLAKDLKV